MIAHGGTEWAEGYKVQIGWVWLGDIGEVWVSNLVSACRR